MPGPCPQPITLTESQQEMLEHLRRCTASAQGLVRRAGIVLASAEGYNNDWRYGQILWIGSRSRSVLLLASFYQFPVSELSSGPHQCHQMSAG
jgi:hypothetical protein